MSLTSPPAARPGGEAGRRERILEAAERVFAARGFHVATMQDVADGAGMSPGNLYRTFASKEAIVEGLCARDQQERAANFAKVGQVESVMAAFAEGLRQHVVSRPRAKARLMVEIWAEAARNPAIAAMSRAVDADILTQLERMIEIAKQRGEASPSVNSSSVARYIFTYVSGLLQRVACNPDFDAEAEGERAFGLFKALCEGKLAPVGTESSP
jgi:TetR/AcrR family transcriptional repressor of uid operon